MTVKQLKEKLDSCPDNLRVPVCGDFLTCVGIVELLKSSMIKEIGKSLCNYLKTY